MFNKKTIHLTSLISIDSDLYDRFCDNYRDLKSNIYYNQYGFHYYCISAMHKLPKCKIIGYINPRSFVIKINNIDYSIIYNFNNNDSVQIIYRLPYSFKKSFMIYNLNDKNFSFPNMEKSVKLLIKAQILI